MAVLSPLAHVGWASLEEELGVLLPEEHISYLAGCLVLSSFTCLAFYPKLVSVPMQTLL